MQPPNHRRRLSLLFCVSALFVALAAGCRPVTAPAAPAGEIGAEAAAAPAAAEAAAPAVEAISEAAAVPAVDEVATAETVGVLEEQLLEPISPINYTEGTCVDFSTLPDNFIIPAFKELNIGNMSFYSVEPVELGYAAGEKGLLFRTSLSVSPLGRLSGLEDEVWANGVQLRVLNDYADGPLKITVVAHTTSFPVKEDLELIGSSWGEGFL